MSVQPWTPPQHLASLLYGPLWHAPLSCLSFTIHPSPMTAVGSWAGLSQAGSAPPHTSFLKHQLHGHGTVPGISPWEMQVEVSAHFSDEEIKAQSEGTPPGLCNE